MYRSPVLAGIAVVTALGAHSPAFAQQQMTLPGADHELRPEWQRLYVVGAGADPRESFQRLDHAAFGPDDRLYLLDASGVGLVVVNPDGRLAGTLGRRGGGPGEFRSPRGVTVLSDGRVAVWDETKRAFVMFGPDGAILDEIRPEYGAGVPDRPFTLAADGSLLASAAWITTPRSGHQFLQGEGMSSAAAGLPLLRIPLRTGAPVEVAARARVPARQPGSALVAFEPWPSWGPLAGRRIAMAHHDDYRVEIVAPGGAMERVLSRPIQTQRPTDADRRAFAQSLEGQTMRTLDGRPGRPVSELPTAEYPVITPVLRIVTDGGRHIWVQRRDPADPTRPGPVDLLTSDGRYLGTIREVPGTPVAFGPEGLVVFFGTGESDEPIAIVYRLPASLRSP